MLDYYKFFCERGLNDSNYDLKILALGLGGETGEVLDIIKKSFRDEKPIDMEHMTEELGDVLWYWVNLCSAMDLSIDKIISSNIEKLKRRYPNVE